MKSFRLLAMTAFAALSVQAGLIHSYDFTLDGYVIDQAGTENGGLSQAGATVANGILTLNGAGWVEFAQHLIPTSGSYSVLLNFRLAGPQNGIAELISQGASGGPGFYIGGDGGVHFRLTDSWATNATTFPTDTNWHSLALVADSDLGNTKFYLDGDLQATLGFAIATTTGGTGTKLGRQFGGYEEYFRGDMDNFRIYDTALSASETVGSETPEPASFALVALGAIGVLVKTRRQRAGDRVSVLHR